MILSAFKLLWGRKVDISWWKTNSTLMRPFIAKTVCILCQLQSLLDLRPLNQILNKTPLFMSSNLDGWVHEAIAISICISLCWSQLWFQELICATYQGFRTNFTKVLSWVVFCPWVPDKYFPVFTGARNSNLKHVNWVLHCDVCALQNPPSCPLRPSWH
jgi:hypothetical protein